MDRETTYAKIRRAPGQMAGLWRPFMLETKRESELRRTPCQGHPVFSTKAAAVGYANREGWVLVNRWHDAGDEKKPATPDMGHAGREGDSGRSITGQAACLLPKFSAREA